MTDSRTTYITEENKLLRIWTKELIQERDSLRQELMDIRTEIAHSYHYPSRSFYSPMEYEDLPF